MADPIFILGNCCSCSIGATNEISVDLTASANTSTDFHPSVDCVHTYASSLTGNVTFNKGTDWTVTSCDTSITTSSVTSPSTGSANNDVVGTQCSCPPTGNYDISMALSESVTIGFRADPADSTKCQANITVNVNSTSTWINPPSVCGDVNFGNPSGAYSTDWFDFTTLVGSYTINGNQTLPNPDGNGTTYTLFCSLNITIS